VEAGGFRIFLASPSGLDEYRRAARERFESIRLAVTSRLGIDFDPVGWEDIPPSFGRPQSVINPKLDECNLLIGILGKQLGTPTGEAASGFVEEYERMAARARNGEDVEIWIYVLQLAPDDTDDPGDKLKEVLAFRDRLYQEALVKEFRNVDDFAGQLYRDLVSLVIDADERRRQRSETVASPSSDGPPAAPVSEPSDTATKQLQELLKEAADEAPFLSERFREDGFPLTRLALWLSTWESWYLTNETFGVHQINRLYAIQGHAELSAPERRHLLRSMCGHRPVAPGWALLGYGADEIASELVSLVGTDSLDEVRVGALDILDRPLLESWLGRGDVDLDMERMFASFRERFDDLSDGVRDAVIDLAARVGGSEPIDFLEKLIDHDAAGQRALQALIRTHVANAPDRALALAAGIDFDLDDRTLIAIRAAAGEADLAGLERLASGSDARLRIIAIELLTKHGTKSVPVLVARLDDSADRVALAAFAALCEVEDPAIDLGASYAKLAERDGLKFDDDLRLALDRTRDSSELRAAINWLDISTASAYRVLAEEHWTEFSDLVRRDLGDGFKTFAEESRQRLVGDLGPGALEAIRTGSTKLAIDSGGTIKPVDPSEVARIREFLKGRDWNDRLFAAAALAGIARNGEGADASLVRPWLDSDHREVRDAAARALTHVGTANDVDKLLELSQTHGDDALIIAAIALSPGPSGAALTILGSTRSASALLAARHLYAYADELPDETLDRLLHHPNEETRRVGVACAVAHYDDSDLKHLLHQYTSGDRYYYNVVFWLDRVLFAPEHLRERTRAELAGLANRDADPLPKVSRGAMQYFPRRFTRSGASS
jgi:hypothetical protein